MRLFIALFLIGFVKAQTPSPTASPVTSAPTSSPTIDCGTCLNGGVCGIRNTGCECPMFYYGPQCQFVKSCACATI